MMQFNGARQRPRFSKGFGLLETRGALSRGNVDARPAHATVGVAAVTVGELFIIVTGPLVCAPQITRRRFNTILEAGLGRVPASLIKKGPPRDACGKPLV